MDFQMNKNRQIILIPQPLLQAILDNSKPPGPALRLMKHKASKEGIWMKWPTKHVFNVAAVLVFCLWGFS